MPPLFRLNLNLPNSYLQSGTPTKSKRNGREGGLERGMEGGERQTKFEHWEVASNWRWGTPWHSQKWCLGGDKTSRILVKKLCGNFRVKKSSWDWEARWSDTTAPALCLPFAQLSHKPLGSGIAV